VNPRVIVSASLGGFLLSAGVAGGQLFGEAERHAAGEAPCSVAVGDLDGDGALDLVAPNRDLRGVDSAYDLSLFFGSGDGGFGAEQRLAIEAGSPRHVALRDLDGDGALDLAVATGGSTRLSVRFGNGDGTFGVERRYVTEGAAGHAVAAGDLDGDGALDLVLTQPQGSGGAVAVLLGDGDGAFSEHVRQAGTGGRSGVVIGDFDGDGAMDLATANQSGGDVSVFRGFGNGFLQPQVRYDVGGQPVSLVADDFDGDGDLDLAVAAVTTLAVALNDGGGTFGEVGLVHPSGSSEEGVVAVDFDLDGAMDLAAPAGIYAARAMTGLGNGVFFADPLFYGDDTSEASDAAAGDFNGDGFPDLAVSDSDNNELVVLLNTGALRGADLDWDRRVDGDDLAALLSVWGSVAAAADLDGDGVVGSGDLGVLLAAWGE